MESSKEHNFIPYEVSALPKGPYLVFAPHPDDETIGMGGTIALASRAGVDVTVVVVTDGAAAGDPATRRSEAHKAADILGVKHLLFWDLPDRGLVATGLPRQRLEAVVDEIQPGTVFAPGLLDFHPDHRAFTLFLLSFLDGRGFDGEIWLYETLRQGEVNRLLDITPVMELKLDGIRAYESQLIQQPYDDVAISINRLRAVTLGSAVRYAEGFWAVGEWGGGVGETLDQVEGYVDHMPRHRGGALVSVVVRTKDRTRLLERALRSIRRQTYRPIEVVLVNDGGPAIDDLLLERALGDLSFKYVHFQENQGRAKAVNAGIEAAGGKYVSMLDDDDEYYPDHLQVLVEFLESHDFKIAYTDCKVVHHAYDQETNRIAPVAEGVFAEPFDKNRLLFGNYIPFNSLLFRREVLQEVGGVDEEFELYEDWDLLIRLSRLYPFYHIPKITCQYNQWSSEQQINQRDVEYMAAAERAVVAKHMGEITPEILLSLRQEKDRKAHHALVVARRLRELRARKDGQIARLRDAVAARDQRIASLLDMVRGQEDVIRNREEIIGQKQEHIRHLEGEMALMRSSLAWRTYERYARARERLLPPGTHRRGAYERLLRALRGRGCGEAGYLARRAFHVIRHEGMAAFLRKAVAHVRCRGASVSGQQPAERYERWIAQNEERLDGEAVRKLLDSLDYKPKISIITPVYNVDPGLLSECVGSVLDQTYPHWELCIYDDGSIEEATKRALASLEGSDERIKVGFGAENLGIAEASNRALEMAEGEFVALLDNDDVLAPNALMEVVLALNRQPDLDYLYSDEDRIGGDVGGRHSPFFKPDWSPHMLFNCMYTGHFSVYRRSVVEKVGGFRKEYDYSQDYDLALRVTEATDRIYHIPKVLYHWREIPSSASAGGKPYARKTNIAALEDAVRRRGYQADVIEYPFANRVRFRLEQPPKVSIIIPTDSEKNIFNCIDLILSRTSYPHYEIVVVTNSALASRLEAYYQDSRVRCERYDGEFNFSHKCNLGAESAAGELLLFLNDDIEVTHGPDWLEELVSVCQLDGVGGVSPKLYYENDTIQFAGMVTGVRDFIGTAFHCHHKDSGFYFNMIQSEREVSILSGACMLVPAKIFREVGGFDAHNTPVMHSDVDLCFRIRDAGYSLIYTPFVSLRHIGHLSLREVDRHPFQQDKAALYLLKKWGDYLSYDPYFPPNMRFLLFEDGDVTWNLSASRCPDRSTATKDVLFVSHDFSLSGAPILVFNLAKQLWDGGVFVTVASPVDGELRHMYEKVGIPTIVDGSLASSPLHGTKRIMAHFDLVVANTLVMWPVVLAAKEIGVPVMLMVHESMAGKALAASMPEVSRALRTADRVIFACRRNASLYEEFLDAGNWEILPYGTKPLECPRKGEENGCLVIHIGSIEPRKGQDVFLDAMQSVRAAVPEARAIMVGRQLDNPEAIPFGREVRKRLSSMEGVEWLGQVDHDEIACLLADAAIFVCSSRDEVFPLTILEAMSMGKAIVTTDVGGVREMLRDGEEGVIVPVGDSKALANAVIELCRNEERRISIGQKAKERFDKDFTIHAFAARFESMVARILG